MTDVERESPPAPPSQPPSGPDPADPGPDSFTAAGYPPARRGDVIDDYHGDSVPDPYRWLEDADSPETRSFVAAQNELTESLLAAVPAREQIRSRLTERWDYPKFGVPFERGGRWFQSRNTGLQNQSVLHVMDAPADEGRVLLDPNLLSADGTVAVAGLAVSPDGSKLAYATATSGSDWLTWRVRDVASGADLGDVIEWSKQEMLEWDPAGSGFYYGAMDPPRPGREYLDLTQQDRVCYHRLGSAQRADEVVFESPDQAIYPEISITPDQRYLVLTLSRGLGPGVELRVLDLRDTGAGLRVLLPHCEVQADVLGCAGETFYVLTDAGADKRRIVAIDLARPGRECWREVIPGDADTLLEGHMFGGRLVCHYLRDACSLLRVFEMDGTFVRDIDVPAMTTLAGNQVRHDAIEGSADSDLVMFEVVSFTHAESLWSHDLRTGTTSLIRPPAAALDPARFVTEQVMVSSPDGAAVPLFLTGRRDLPRDGDNPVLLQGYGGVGICTTPSFKVPWAVFVERGGILAVASLRGGGEYGSSWYEAGRRANKQNVFDDFCACARWLADSGWSRAGRIAINGGSNGGLLVGACLTQHPELFGAAVADVGVMDMLRFHRFTVGWAWKTEYGDPENPAEYPWLRAYSPLHNAAPGRYPPTLMTTGDHDDRVVPGHSYKFTAALQAAQQGPDPVLLRVETAAGHGGGKPTTKAIAEATDRLTFLAAALAR
ncbi:MAG TPA: prolyl oligopeptidase family serine peptidase [Streptosporangiaceae bacterium]|jgi:prolyl oligopeptidase